MFKRIILLSIFLMLLFSCSAVFAEISAGDLTLAGYVKTETSLRVEGLNNDLTKFKNIFQLSGEYPVNDYVTLFSKVRYWYDAAYDFRDEYDSAQDVMGHVQRTEWLRDLYLDYENGPWFLRLGKQQVAWGQADGIPVLDRVHPFDLTEYWLQDFEYLRIPLWMANINFSPKINSNLQILIIPDFEGSTAAPPVAPFAFRSYRQYENWRVNQAGVDVNIYYPGRQFENSTFGVQWSDRIGDLNYTLNYLYGFYYTARNTTIFTRFTPPANFFFKVDRAFKRYSLYGASFNKTFTRSGPLQGITLRGDFAYYKDEPTYFGNVNTSSAQGINRWDNIFWLIGADRYVATNWLVSFQFAQYIMQDAKPGVGTFQTFNAYTYGPQDQVENIFSLRVSTDFMNERLKPEILWSLTDDGQGRVSPKVNFEIRDNLWLTVGIHYFYGNEWDSNGQFRDQSQCYTHVKFTF
jgi:hypothetical protein